MSSPCWIDVAFKRVESVLAQKVCRTTELLMSAKVDCLNSRQREVFQFNRFKFHSTLGPEQTLGLFDLRLRQEK
jgi:hypothetical protein